MEIDSPRPWSVERRLQFIEFRLFWEGRINRSDLVEYFGISAPQASSDLAHYQELAGDNLRYDRRAKTYLAAPDFTPRLTEPNARLYLANLRLIADEVLTERDIWAGWLPPFAALPSLRRRIDTEKLREVLSAIHTSSAIRIRYQSFSRPEAMWRWITPHALGFDGRRWHVRAWCHENEDFRDFVFARMLETAETRSDDVDPSDDLEWQLEVTARLAPHPDMGEAQRQVIELDYGMKEGIVEVPMRLSLTYYFVNQFGLDADPSSTPPSRQQVVLLNRQEIDSLRQVAREASRKRALERRAHRLPGAAEAPSQRRERLLQARANREPSADAMERPGDSRMS